MCDQDFESGDIKEAKRHMGRCPYCKYLGYIPDIDWCEHHVGTFDWCRGSETQDCLVPDSIEADRFRGFLANLDDLKYKKAVALIDSVPLSIREALEQAYERNGLLYWFDWVRKRTLETNVDEFLFSTTYVSVFIKDKAVWKERVLKKTRRILAFVESSQKLKKLLSDEPA